MTDVLLQIAGLGVPASIVLLAACWHTDRLGKGRDQ